MYNEKLDLLFKQQDIEDNIPFEHNNNDITRLVNNNKSPSSKTVTAIIHMTSTKQLDTQLNTILHQTHQPFIIWIVYSKELETVLTMYIQSLPAEQKTLVHLYEEKGDVTDNNLLTLLLHATTDYIWLVKDKVNVGQQYLETLLSLSMTKEYDHKFLGVYGLDQQNNCIENKEREFKSMEVSSIDHTWLLHRSWLSPLTLLPDTNQYHLGSWLSQQLYDIGIPSVLLPDDHSLTTITKSCDLSPLPFPSLTTTAISSDGEEDGIIKEQEQNTPDSFIFFVDQFEQLDELTPLICHQNHHLSQILPIHILMTGVRSQHFFTPEVIRNHLIKFDPSCTHPVIHNTGWLPFVGNQEKWYLGQKIVHQLPTLLQQTRLNGVLIHTLRQNDPLTKALQLSPCQDMVTVIGLPSRDINHAQWIMDIPLSTLKRWNDFKIQLMITTDRNPRSLARLLRSAHRAHYLGDQVDITVLMDQSSDKVTQKFINDIQWMHGDKKIRHRIVKMNRMPIFVESWYPQSNDDYAILLNDNIELSDMYYIWAKRSLLHYRYNYLNSDNDQTLSKSVMGISLYTPALIDSYKTEDEVKPDSDEDDSNNINNGDNGDNDGNSNESSRKLFQPSLSSTTHPFLMQLMTNGGTLVFPEHWREFHDYITARFADIRKKQLQNITIPLARSSTWINSWRKYMDELMYLRGYVLIYPLHDAGQSYSTIHLDLKHHHTLENGTFANDLMKQFPQLQQQDHAHDEAMMENDEDHRAVLSLFNVPLIHGDMITNDDNPFLQHQQQQQQQPNYLPDLDTLTTFDLWGHPLPHTILTDRGRLLQQSVSACPPSLDLAFDPSDLLCPFARIVELPMKDVTVDVLPTRVATLFVPPTPA
ncbi:hypothetical protein BJ944DRAFT_235908 [Cunninghamella echinulata]|nr:hypothetical protein BJ944DRAFT_235908 [Cunninghamella echinulata]